MIHRIAVPVLLTVAMFSKTARAQAEAAKPLSREQEDALFLADACEPVSVDTALWPRYRIGDVTIAVPAQYRVSRRIPNTLIFRSSYGSLSITSHRNTSLYALSGPNRASSRPRPKEAWCDDASYGGYRTEIHAFIEQGRYNLSAKWEATWGSGDETEWISASFGTSRPEEANRLRAALNTMLPVKDEAGTRDRGNPNGWFWNPCLPDSVDTFGWTRYDLRGLRLRAPREVRQVKVPSHDEVLFRAGTGNLRLRLHNDASHVFAEVNKPDKTVRHCQEKISGQLTETISFRPGQTSFGFAVLWPDAERGEWLAAVITASKVEDATLLRRVLFTITFPDKRR